MLEWDSDLAINVGDVVTSGDKYAEWRREHFDPIHPLATNVTTYIAIGNHEENSHWFDEYVCQPGNEHFFAFTYGNTRFIVCDTNWSYHPGLKKPLTKRRQGLMTPPRFNIFEFEPFALN